MESTISAGGAEAQPALGPVTPQKTPDLHPLKAEGLGMEEQHSQQNRLIRWKLPQAQQTLTR